VLRITGHEAGLARAQSAAAARRTPKDRAEVDPALRRKDAPRLTPIVPLTLEEVDRLQKAAQPR
jgi:hypothetical protein